MSSLFLDYSLPALHQKLKQKILTFADLANETIDKIGKNEKEVHAWVHYDIGQLKSDANKLIWHENITPVAGMPFGVKDIFNTKAYPTEMGSPIWKDFTPGNNARVVDSLLNSDALVAGKTVTAEFAVHALNSTLNPHDVTRTPGTSSSGSAAAVAIGMVPFALATQTAGSIIRPASFCGVWGMKPSFGMIPRTGVLKTTDSLDTIGFVASHLDSLRVILTQTRVKGPNYPFVYKNVDSQGERPKVLSKKWRIGFVKTHTWLRAEAYVKQAVEDLAKKIGGTQGFSVEEIHLPEIFQSAHETHETIYTKSLAYYFQHEKKMSSHITPLMSDMIDDGEPISAKNFKNALRQQECLKQLLDELILPFDLVLSIGTASAAPLREDEALPDPSLIWTLCHVPAVGVPVFRCPEGLPFGVQFIGKKWSDYLLLQGVEALVDARLLPAGSLPVLNKRKNFKKNKKGEPAIVRVS